MSPERQKVFHKAEVERGGFMRLRANPLAAQAVILEPVGSGRTECDKIAFRNRVAKRRAKKGYR